LSSLDSALLFLSIFSGFIIISDDGISSTSSSTFGSGVLGFLADIGLGQYASNVDAQINDLKEIKS
jgi:hypothetical protein